AEETLHDSVLFWGVGRDELLADSVVLAGSPKTPALEDQSVVTAQHRRDTVGPQRAKALDARRLERPFGLLGPAPAGKLLPDEFAVMAVDHGGEMRPAVGPAVDVGEVHCPALIAPRRPAAASLHARPRRQSALMHKPAFEDEHTVHGFPIHSHPLMEPK